MSEVSEWMAIALALLAFAADMVRGTFDKAIRLDPSNERAKKNLAAFEAANKPIPITAKIWETRTAGANFGTGRAALLVGGVNVDASPPCSTGTGGGKGRREEEVESFPSSLLHPSSRRCSLAGTSQDSCQSTSLVHLGKIG